MYEYDEHLNLIINMRGIKSEGVLKFYEGYFNKINIPYGKNLQFQSNFDKDNFHIKDNDFSYKYNVAISQKDINVLDNRNTIKNILRNYGYDNDRIKEIISEFIEFKKYKNVFLEDVIEIVMDSQVIKLIDKKSTILEVQAEKYKCFYENDFLKIDSCIEDLDDINIDLIDLKEERYLIKSNNIKTETINQSYESGALRMSRNIKKTLESSKSYDEIIADTSWRLETYSGNREQKFSKTNNLVDNSSIYEYLYNPKDENDAFKFFVEEDNDNMELKQIFVFGLVGEENKFTEVSSVIIRKNSVKSAFLAKNKTSDKVKAEDLKINEARMINDTLMKNNLSYYIITDLDIPFDVNDKNILKNMTTLEESIIKKINVMTLIK